MTALEYSYSRYLRAKRTVDDRALNRAVLEAAVHRLPGAERPPEIAEIGGGVGTMVDRLIESRRIPQADYLIVDVEAQFLDEVQQLAPQWAEGKHRRSREGRGGQFRVTTQAQSVEDWVETETRTFDLVVAQAVLDLVDVAAVLPKLMRRVRPGGTLWATINFDGDTIFMPRVDGDVALMAAYHESMDRRAERGRGQGSSTTGRELFGHAAAAGAQVLAAGSSDWVVFAQPTGTYVDDEAYFLHHIVHTVDEELRDHPALGEVARAWAKRRHAQVDERELVYIAHQLDFALIPGEPETR